MLTLRRMRAEDEAEAEDAHRQLAAEGFPFLLDQERAGSFHEYLDLLDQQRTGEDPHPGRVRGTFLVAEVNGRIVGRVSIRHALNDYLQRVGGHIGFAVLPAHRRRGYATEILHQSLRILAEEGIDRALVTCDEENVASATIIEHLGGELTGRVDDDGVLIRQYLLATK